jgi:hypothetical protein
MLLPGDKIRERAQALTMRGQAFWGLGRIDEAQAAMKGAAQRYDELGDAKLATAVNERLQAMQARDDATAPVEPAEEEPVTELELVGAEPET